MQIPPNLNVSKDQINNIYKFLDFDDASLFVSPQGQTNISHDVISILKNAAFNFISNKNKTLIQFYETIKAEKKDFIQTLLKTYDTLTNDVIKAINTHQTKIVLTVECKYANVSYQQRTLETWLNVFKAEAAAVDAFMVEIHKKGYYANIRGISDVEMKYDEDDTWYIGGEKLYIDCKFC